MQELSPDAMSQLFDRCITELVSHKAGKAFGKDNVKDFRPAYEAGHLAGQALFDQGFQTIDRSGQIVGINRENMLARLFSDFVVKFTHATGGAGANSLTYFTLQQRTTMSTLFAAGMRDGVTLAGDSLRASQAARLFRARMTPNLVPGSSCIN